MKLYAEGHARRVRQICGDVLLVVWIAVWVRVADKVHDLTLGLATPGEKLNEAGTGLAEQLRDAGSTVSGLPVVGDQVRTPLDGAGDAADQIAAAGTSQVQAVESLAFWLAVSLAVIPILVVCAVYLPVRWRFAREATAGQRFIDAAEDLDLFALRALSKQPMHRLARISDDPAGAWRRQDPVVIKKLGLLELRDVGLEYE
jgi:hypothetical protein